jgi:hypothetical protein
LFHSFCGWALRGERNICVTLVTQVNSLEKTFFFSFLIMCFFGIPHGKVDDSHPLKKKKTKRIKQKESQGPKDKYIFASQTDRCAGCPLCCVYRAKGATGPISSPSWKRALGSFLWPGSLL